MSAEWYHLTDGSFGDYILHVAEPRGTNVHGAQSITWKLSRRLQRSRKPLVDGAAIRDLGGNEIDISFEIVFFGPNYMNEYLEFEKSVTKGKPEILTIPIYPRGIQCYFAGADIKAGPTERNTLRVTVNFVQDEVTTQTGSYSSTKELTQADMASMVVVESAKMSLASGAEVEPSELLSASKISELKEATEVNPFIAAIRAAESGVSTVMRYSGAIQNLDRAVRARISNLTDQYTNALASLSSAVALIEDLTNSGSNDQTSSGFLATEQDRSIVEFSVDTETDQDTTASESATNTSAFNLGNNTAITETLNGFKESLIVGSENISTASDGGTSDIVTQTKALNRIIAQYASFFEEPKLSTILLGRKMSLIEVMHFNGIDINNIETVYNNNLHILDPAILEAGEVVYL